MVFIIDRVPVIVMALIVSFIAAGVVIVLLGVRHSRIKPENNPT